MGRVLIGLLVVGGRRLEHLKYLACDPLLLRFARVQVWPTARTVSRWRDREHERGAIAMILSPTFRLTYGAAPARLRVVRNNGCCWAEICTESGERLTVSTSVDHYERNDEDAAREFITAAGDPSCIEPSRLELDFTAAPDLSARNNNG